MGVRENPIVAGAGAGLWWHLWQIQKCRSAAGRRSISAHWSHNAGVAAVRGGDVMAVVKADAYGHGMVAVGAALESHVDAFGVASIDEGMRLRAAGCRRPVMVLGAVAPELFPWLIDHGLQASISSLAEAQALDTLASRAGKPAQVHLVFDTGMGRIGFLDTSEIGRVRSMGNLEVVGVASHYPSADEDEEFTRAQTGEFLPSWSHR